MFLDKKKGKEMFENFRDLILVVIAIVIMVTAVLVIGGIINVCVFQAKAEIVANTLSSEQIIEFIDNVKIS